MASVDLLFSRTPLTQPADLVFGEGESLTDYEVTLVASFPLSFSADVREVYETEIAVAFPLTLSASAAYSSNVARPLVGKITTDQQSAVPAEVGVQDHAQQIAQALYGVNVAFSQGVYAPHSQSLAFQSALRSTHPGHRTRQQSAERVGTWAQRSTYQEGLRDRRQAPRTSFQDASPLRQSQRHDWQERIRHPRPSLKSTYNEAVRLHARRGHGFGSAIKFDRGWWTRYQEAMRPPPGASAIGPVQPPFDPCYLPDPDLLFSAAFGADGNLVFICDRHDQPDATVIVPIRRVYVVINNISLRRVSNNAQLPAFDMSLSIDADSWTWSFSATLPVSALSEVQRDAGDPPIELEANINGNLYRVLAESISSTRSFGQHSIRIAGRGKSALLASPYAPVLTFANSTQRTAQQLMADVLQFNNVPIGWDVDWQIDDWLVPAGVFAMQGTYIEGLSAVAGAAGAYLQPHPTLQEMRVLLRYPVAPWDWAGVTPDYELPSAVTLQEGIEWVDRADYNGVYVSGITHGNNALVFKSGTSGELTAPMVVDALITEAAANRQRGLAVLGNTGRKAMVSLRLPVLSETGVIEPGRFVRYNDVGSMKTGIVRSVSVEARMPEVWQNLTVETQV